DDHGRLERVHLPPERVAAHGHVDAAEGLLVGPAVEDPARQQDHAGARAVRGHAGGDALAQRFQDAELDRELAHRRGLAAGDDQRVDGVEFVGAAYRTGQHVALGQRGQVFPDVALKGEHTDDHQARHQPRDARRSLSGSVATLMPTIASPSPRDTLAIISGSSWNVVALTIAAARLAGSPDLKMPEPTNTPSAPSCIIIAASAGV